MAERSNERGVALFHVVLLLTMMAAVASGTAMLARVEVLVSSHHRDARVASYAAQAMLAATIHDLDRAPDWSDVLAGRRSAGFSDGVLTGPKQIPGAGTVTVCCGGGTLTARVQAETGAAWTPFAWQSFSSLVAADDAAKYYLAAWVLDDEDDPDGDPLRDSNGRLSVRVEAVGPRGARTVVLAMLRRDPMVPASGAYPPGLQLLTWREIR
jgi:hypothetical protein